MYLKRYTIGALLLMFFVGWYVSQFLGYSQTESISFFGVNLPGLPIAILVLLPVFVLYILSVAHMLYYSIKNFFNQRNFQKDYDKLLDAIVDALLMKNETHQFKTPRYELLGKLIDSTTMMPKLERFETDNEKIDAVLDVLSKLKEGKAVDLKKFHLEADNPLVVQNQKNRMMNLDVSYEEIMSKGDKYSRDVLEKAFMNFAAAAPLYAIEKYQKFISKDALFIILARVNSEENTLEVSNDSLLGLMRQLELNRSDYVSISKELSIHMLPEQRIKLFELLADEDEEAQEAYFYTLFDLEMIDKAKECLETIGNNDAMKFRAYLALKECGHNFNINLFI